MALRPAPVQITAIGYPASTGNRAIDYRLVDAHTDPPGSEPLCTEKLLRLDPCFLCYQPPATAPQPRPPIEPNEGLVLGSFNAFQKLSPMVLGLWREALARLPDARLALKGAMVLGREAGERLRRTIEAAGLPLERLDLLTTNTDRDDHLKTYHKVHIALDTYPYHGTTTTCEALYMGVPVITLAGGSHASRVGCSLLSAVGCRELIVTDETDYTEKIVALAQDRERLRRYHATMRNLMLDSPLLDQAHYQRQIVALLRQVTSGRGSNP
jgi:predicted O-linked N-acetylglucosamine transferase (SPINDLY family)